ncbi:GNAT family N-acetyltransferase [Anthocerotibacter panamensis]|uniref:GNAT family N-acetyltransferase n=1 Tax=Anthocerotibacter panamensis TaxID=2857077 RepID=UPI001C406BCA|nr:GNAT family N-acetyltransferase [Anthocerotibacter panamensis]
MTLLDPYRLTRSRSWQGGLLLKFLQRAYRELNPGNPLDHLDQTVEQFYQPERTPLWLLEHPSGAVACLWLGPSIDQTTGSPAAYVFLVYVHPDHRRRGLATYLLQTAIQWSYARGYTQIHLQVLVEHRAAQALYQKLGFTTQAYLMRKSLP